MRKLCFLVLICLLAISLSGCLEDGGNQAPPDAGETNGAQAETPAEEASAEESGTSEAPEGETETSMEEEPLERQIMDGLSALLADQHSLIEVVDYINQNISLLSEENASLMINQLEEAQKNFLPQWEEKFYDEELQNKINRISVTGLKMDQINDVPDLVLKGLLSELRDSGYKLETAEGMHFPVIDYGAYTKYIPYVTADLKEYLEIMAIESDMAPAKDAALVISWNEVLQRALAQEKFISRHPDSTKINEIKQLYKKYLFFIFNGPDNTPLFSHTSRTISAEAKNAYLQAVESNENSSLLTSLRTFLDLLEKSNYRLTDEVKEYRDNILQGTTA